MVEKGDPGTTISLANKVAICLLLELMAHWAPACHHALLVSQDWAHHPREMDRRQRQGYGWVILKEEQEGVTREEKGRGGGESERIWPEHWGLAKSPSLSSTPSPPSAQPLPDCLSLDNGCFSAEISRYWIPGLEFCPPTISRQRSMLQGRHTLQVKSWKTIPPFISIKKGDKVPRHPSFFSIIHFFPVSKLGEGYQTQSRSSGSLWFVD